MLFDWRMPKDTTSDQIVLPAYSAPDGECDNMDGLRVEVELVTHSVKGNKLSVKDNCFTEGNREKLAEAFATFISVDNTRA